MKFTRVKPEGVAQIAWGCIAFSIASAILLLVFAEIPAVRAVVGSLGFNSAWLAGGVGIWGALRLRTQACVHAGLASIVPLAIWGALIVWWVQSGA